MSSTESLEPGFDPSLLAPLQADYTGLRILAVHAHPDDESSKGASTMAAYVARGARVMVASMTGGERGDILNEAVNSNPAAAGTAVARGLDVEAVDWDGEETLDGVTLIARDARFHGRWPLVSGDLAQEEHADYGARATAQEDFVRPTR